MKRSMTLVALMVAFATTPLGGDIARADTSSFVVGGIGSVHARVRIPGAVLLDITVDGMQDGDAVGVLMNGSWHEAPLALFGVPLENPLLQSTWLRWLAFIKGPGFQMPRTFLNPNGGPSQAYFLSDDQYDLYAIAPAGRRISFTFTFDRPGVEVLGQEPWEGNVGRIEPRTLAEAAAETHRTAISVQNDTALVLGVDMETTVTAVQYYKEIHRARQDTLVNRCAYGGDYVMTALPLFPLSWIHQAWSLHRLTPGDWTVGVDYFRSRTLDPMTTQTYAMTFPIHPGDEVRFRPHGIVGGYTQGFAPQPVREGLDSAACVDPLGVE